MKVLLLVLVALVASVRGDKIRRVGHDGAVHLEESRRLGYTTKKARTASRMEMQRKSKKVSKSKSKKEAKSKKGAKKGKKGSKKQSNVQRLPQTRMKPMETISLGNKRPEGITKGPGNTMFVSEMLFGGIRRVNVVTGAIQQVVPSYGFRERGAYGVIEAHGALFVAGGGVPDGMPPKFYVYDATTGAEIVACDPDFDAFLLNDVAILGDHAYVTDSKFNMLMVVNIPKALEGECDVMSIKTPEALFLADDATFPRSNGIIAHEGGLIVARTSPGGLYYLDLKDEDMPTIELASPDKAPRNDGMAIVGDLLYVTENTLNSISVWSLKNTRRGTAMMRDDPLPFVGRISVPTVDFPATVEVCGEKYLCTVDARLRSLPVTDEEGEEDFGETFNMVCIADREDVDD